MKSKLLAEADTRVYALVFATGDEVAAEIGKFAAAEAVSSAQVTGIGAFSAVTLGYFNWETKEYEKHEIEEQVEVLSLIGDIALKDDEPALHAHLTVGRSDMSVRGGHLIEATVRPTLELVMHEAPAHLRKRHDPESGLALISIDASD
jgi:predicted DNA-binding protein with PD1-like motif